MYSEKMIHGLLTFAFIGVLVKFVVFGDLFHSNVYKGNGYSIVPPAGWVKIKQPRTVGSGMGSAEKPDIATFVTPEKTATEEAPEASLSILTVKLGQPVWMEDEFPTILSSLAMTGGRIINKGQIKIDTLISWWVLYEDPQTSLLQLEFYMVNDLNRLFKIQYAARADAFPKHRPAFEAAKDSIKFSMSIW